MTALYFSHLSYSRHNRIPANIIIRAFDLIPALTGLADQGQTADVAAHFGTLAAVVLYLHRDITKMISSILPVTKTDKASLRLIGLLILSSLPVILSRVDY